MLFDMVSYMLINGVFFYFFRNFVSVMASKVASKTFGKKDGILASEKLSEFVITRLV